MAAMITRSTGIVPGFPYMGPLPGGGYRGVTEELDAIVAQAADRLAAATGLDVTIRFNADRRSGGAFLADEATYGVVGICAGIRKDYQGRSIHEVIGLLRADWDALPDLAPVISTNVAARSLRDPDATNQGNPEHRYSYLDHPDLDAALAWLRQNATVPE